MKKGWEYKKLGEVCDLYQPKTISTKEMVPGGEYDVFGANGIIGKFNQYNHEKPEILMTCRGATCGNLNISTPKSWINGNAMVIHIKNESLLNRTFLVHALTFIDKKNIITGTAQPQITRQTLAPLIIPVPPLSEQQSIVDYLDSAFAKIDAMKANAEKALNEAKALFQASLKEMLEPKDGWEEKKMSSLYDVRDGTHDSPKYQGTGYPLVTSKNLRGGVLDMTKVHLISESDYVSINNRSKVDMGDVLFAMIGTIGNPVYVLEEPNYAIKNMALFKVSEEQSGKFLYYYLQKDDVIKKMQNESKGTTQKFVSLGYLRNFVMRIPSFSEQQSIVATLDSLKSKVDKLQDNYDKISQECDALKQAILRKVFE